MFAIQESVMTAFVDWHHTVATDRDEFDGLSLCVFLAFFANVYIQVKRG